MADRDAGSHSHLPEGNVWIIANPIAGGWWGRWRREEAIRFLQSRLHVSEVRWTQRRGDAEQWAREAAAGNVGLVICSGGDGTINEIANGLAGSPVALGILPAGTVNVIACELGIPFDPVKATVCILKGKTERLHIGCAEYPPLAGEQTTPDFPSSFILHPSSFHRRYFLFAAGVGFDAAVCRHVNTAFKRWGRKLAYCLDGLRLFLGYRSPQLRVTLDGAAPTACSELIVAKARSYAGRFYIAPEASLRKPDLDACMFLRPGRWNLVRYALGIARGKHTTYSDVLCRKAESIEVTADKPVYLQLDGDAVGTTPVRFTVLRDALSVVVPAD
jgi:YegS/Rv2252/BmrU family lipid kinase